MKKIVSFVLSAFLCGFLFGCEQYTVDITDTDVSFRYDVYDPLPEAVVPPSAPYNEPGIYIDCFTNPRGSKIKDLSFIVVITSSENPLYQFRDVVKYSGIVSYGMSEYYNFTTLNKGDFVIDKVEFVGITGKKK